MGKKYIIDLNPDCSSEFKGIIVFGLTPNGEISAEPIPVEDLTPYTEPDLEQVRKGAFKNGYDAACKDIDIKSKTNAAYQKGLADAWEAARTLWNTPNRKEIFGHTTFNTVLTTLTAQETIEKIRQYEQEKEEYHIGDEVIRHYKNEFMEGDDTPSIFLSEEDGHFRCLAFNGRSIMIAEYPKNQYRKTGRHFPEIAEVLKKMRETTT